ncbi:YbjQ family protein [Parapedobacter soli]|uniref:YbjQ family protein n=1 Tax=Parapedobacter soli TaxID=416955 RepID=UPI0021C5B1B6|nr:YbjQ family protein [Parapedobacter soli]
MNQFTTTTTNSIEGWDIKEYLQPVSSNVVVGANIFSDFAASITDFFGGRSDGYERRLNEIYDQALKALINKARSIGANAIVGVKIDFGEVSGKGNQMFMVSVVGTPVKAVKRGDKAGGGESSSYEVYDGELVERKVRAKNIIERFDSDKPAISKIPENTVNFIVESRLPELCNLVMGLLSVWSMEPASSSKQLALPKYFDNLDTDSAINGLYSYLEKHDIDSDALRRFLKIASDNNLIDYEKLKPLLYNNHLNGRKFALELLRRGKASYSAKEIELLRKYSDDLVGLFQPLGTTDQVKGMFSSTAKEVWVCVCGTKNNQSVKYCGNCYKDNYGFYEAEVKPETVANLIRKRLDVISTL